MSPLGSDNSLNNSADYWRAWNSQVASGANPNFGAFDREYQANQQLSRLPFQQQQAAIMNQHQVQQDAFSNRRALQQDQFAMGREMWDRNLDTQRLTMAQEAARRQAEQDDAKYGYDKSMADRRAYEAPLEDLARMERIMGHNPLEILQLIKTSPDFQRTGKIKLPSKWGTDPLTKQSYEIPGQEMSIYPEGIRQIEDIVSRMRGNYGQSFAPTYDLPNKPMTPEAIQERQALETGSPVQAKLMRLRELEAKRAAEVQAAARAQRVDPMYQPQGFYDGGY